MRIAQSRYQGSVSEWNVLECLENNFRGYPWRDEEVLVY